MTTVPNASRPNPHLLLALIVSAFIGCAPPPSAPASRAKPLVVVEPAIARVPTPEIEEEPVPKPFDPATSDHLARLKTVKTVDRLYLDRLTIEVIAGRKRVEILRQTPDFGVVLIADPDKVVWSKRVAGAAAAQVKAEKNWAAEVSRIAALTTGEWERGLFLRNSDAGNFSLTVLATNMLREVAERAVTTEPLADLVKMPEGPDRDDALNRQYDGVLREADRWITELASHKSAKRRLERIPNFGDQAWEQKLISPIPITP